jgi:hypothetical protein
MLQKYLKVNILLNNKKDLNIKNPATKIGHKPIKNKEENTMKSKVLSQNMIKNLKIKNVTKETVHL